MEGYWVVVVVAGVSISFRVREKRGDNPIWIRRQNPTILLFFSIIFSLIFFISLSSVNASSAVLALIFLTRFWIAGEVGPRSPALTQFSGKGSSSKFYQFHYLVLTFLFFYFFILSITADLLICRVKWITVIYQLSSTQFWNIRMIFVLNFIFIIFFNFFLVLSLIFPAV